MTMAPVAPPEAPPVPTVDTATVVPADHGPGAVVSELPLPLEGEELLGKIAALRGQVTRAELIRQCGYVARTKDGEMRQRAGAFDRAIVDAMNVVETVPAEHGPRAAVSMQLVVNSADRITVGAYYVHEAGLRAGDVVGVEVQRDQGTILLRVKELASNPGVPA